MGYTTVFEGSIAIEPPLSEIEREFLARFIQSRRWDRPEGPYETREEHEERDAWRGARLGAYNDPPLGQPGLWCQWEASEDGRFLRWDGGEKFYAAAEWMAYLIHHFFAPHPWAKEADSRFEGFGGHVFNGEILAIGEEAWSDAWLLKVRDNSVSVVPACWPQELIDRWEGHYVDAGEALGHSHQLLYAAEETPIPDFAEELGQAPYACRERAQIDESAEAGAPGQAPLAL